MSQVAKHKTLIHKIIKKTSCKGFSEQTFSLHNVLNFFSVISVEEHTLGIAAATGPM